MIYRPLKTSFDPFNPCFVFRSFGNFSYEDLFLSSLYVSYSLYLHHYYTLSLDIRKVKTEIIYHHITLSSGKKTENTWSRKTDRKV